MGEFKEYIARRNAAFESDDVQWAAEQLPATADPQVVEMAFHKARLACISVSEGKRRESLIWLADRGLRDLAGSPLRHDGALAPPRPRPE